MQIAAQILSAILLMLLGIAVSLCTLLMLGLSALAIALSPSRIITRWRRRLPRDIITVPPHEDFPLNTPVTIMGRASETTLYRAGRS